ncbi:MAG: RagB/SusD family nutrient uptake outer membrane protein [Cytophagales bacterium]|nr:RagB/SusD family nutrient uptake outer membrane protein [Bernardetiaceae bacterium]MDW8206114.1 RagB/SusD family nutrient uptake outer membrane protein [Cytophagales bacterium]
MNKKTTLRVLLLTGLLIGVNTSCQRLLEPSPIGQQTVDATFTDFAGTLSAVNGLYNVLSGRNLYRGNNNLLYIDYASDDVIGSTSRVAGTAYNILDYFEIVADNPISYELWDDLYRLIYRANVIIERTPAVNIPLGQSRNSAGLLFRDQFIGEAKFMRAFAYFNLVRLFGDVPLHVKEIKSASEVNIPRTPVAQVYAQIERDLIEAATQLPPSYSGSGLGNEIGRVTRWSALAMLADVYLTQRKFAEARATALRVINESDRILMPNYRDNFAARGGQENSRESLFEIQFANQGATVGTAPLANNYGFIMDAINVFNGGTASLAAYRPTDDEDTGNEVGFTGGLIQAFEDGDLRRDVCFTRGLGTGGRTVWLTWKHHVVGSGATNQVNFPVYRLAEMLLIYAEAQNELGGPDAQAYEFINRIRRRAFGLPLNQTSTRDLPPGLSQAAFREAVRLERRRELAMENKRWFDLLRYGFEFADRVLRVNQRRTDFNRNKMLLPIAQVEIVNNPLLTQNPGY